MGEYIGICIGKFEYLWSKNSFGDLLMLFSKEDLKITEVNEDGNVSNCYCFHTSVSKAKQLLDGIGYTLKSTEKQFEICKNAILEYRYDDCDDELYNKLTNEFIYENWIAAVKKYSLILSKDRYSYKNNRYENLYDEKQKDLTITEKIVLDSLPFGTEEYFGLPYDSINVWYVFRVILESFNNDEEILLDYSNLYYGGWSDEYPSEQEYEIEKTIILTEGKYDAIVISECMKLLYPHMSKLYSFMNFEKYKNQGSTNFVTHYFKAFISAGIKNRVIALYDNDSAGLAEIDELKKYTYPDNFKYIHLPNIELAKHYPTIGPSGKEVLNINGTATSIELFLGKDVLTNNGELYPVRWKGFVEKTGTYQGEISYKDEIQKQFKMKYERAVNSDTLDRTQWNDMIILLDSIFNAFN